MSTLTEDLQDNWHGDSSSNQTTKETDDAKRPSKKTVADALGNDAEDLAILTRQLSSQMEYNNVLLEHLQALEESHLEAQREMKKKEHALKLALSVSNAAKEEIEELKQKCNNSSRAADAMANKCQDAKVEADRKERELQMQKRQVTEAKHLYEQVLRQKTSIEDRMQRTEHELEAMKNELHRQKSLDEAKIRQLTASVDGLTRDLESLRQKHLPLSNEHKRLSHNTVQLQREMEEANNRLILESNGRAVAEQRIKDLEVSILKLKEGQKELNFYLKEEQAKVALLESDVLATTEAKRKADSEVESHETYLAALKKQHKDAVEENKALKHELEHMANELLQQARQRGDEQRRWAEKLTKAQEDLAKVTEDTRLQTQRHALEGQRRSAESLAVQKQAEDQVVALQKEHADLHEILKTVQEGHAEEANKLQQEREAYKAEVQGLKEKLAQTEERLEEREKELLAIIDKLGDEVKSVRFEMGSRGGRYVQMLGTVQQAIRTLAREGAACKDEVADIASDFQTLQECVKTFTSNQSAPLDAWYEEMTAGMDALIQQNKGLKKELDEKDESVQEKEETVEGLKTDVVKHQDEISSLRHELMAEQDKLSNEKRTYEQKLSNAKEETERVRKEKNEAERRFKRLQGSLDMSNNQNLNLQSQCQQLTKEVAELRADQALITKRMEGDIIGLQQKCRTLNTSKLDLLHERESILRALEEEEKDKINLHDKIKELEAIVYKQRGQLEQMEKGAQRKVSELNQLLQQSSRQLENTQKLMGVMRQGKTEGQIVQDPTAA